jgi:hypothetical protein
VVGRPITGTPDPAAAAAAIAAGFEAVLVKICGIKDVTGLEAAREAGADMVGFVFFPPSPRAVTPTEASLLARSYTGGPKRVGLFVDPDDATLAATWPKSRRYSAIAWGRKPSPGPAKSACVSASP